MTEQKTQPEKKFRAGAVCATIWKNEAQGKDGEMVSYRTVTLQRGYKDKEDKWQNTGSLRLNDLPRLQLLLNKAYEYLVMQSNPNQEEIAQVGKEVETPAEEVV